MPFHAAGKSIQPLNVTRARTMDVCGGVGVGVRVGSILLRNVSIKASNLVSLLIMLLRRKENNS
jgi:hypothetical protein